MNDQRCFVRPRFVALAMGLMVPIGQAAFAQNVEACYAETEIAYSVPTCILRAIHDKESSGSLRKGIVNRNRDGSRDYGAMQHNDFWIRYFNRNFGITADQFADNTCLSIRGAGYVLRYEINRAGDFWKGVGRYHNPDPVLGYNYAVSIAQRAEKFGCQISR